MKKFKMKNVSFLRVTYKFYLNFIEFNDNILL